MEQMMLIKFPFNIIAAGTSKSGKSWLIKYLLKTWCQQKKFQAGLVFTGTKFNGDYTSFLPNEYVLDGFNQKVLLKFMDTLKKLDKRTQEQIDNGAPCMIPHTFVVFDDILSEMNLQTP